MNIHVLTIILLKVSLNTKIPINARQTIIKKNEPIKNNEPETTNVYNIDKTPTKDIIFKSPIIILL